jgi:hypothetical protein
MTATRAGHAELSAEIQALLPEIGNVLSEIDLAGRELSAQASQRQWDIGRRILGATATIGEGERTRILRQIADSLEPHRSLAHLLNLVNVAEAWPEHLPGRSWTSLSKLARLPADQREQLELELPLDAPASRIPNARGSHQGMADRGAVALEEREHAEALRRVLALRGNSLIPLLAEALDSLNLDHAADLPPRSASRWGDRIFQAAHRLRELIAEAAPSPAEANDEDPSSG